MTGASGDYSDDYLEDYACKASGTRGREVAEAEDPNRSPYQRDRDRIIHSSAFRRLKHKTQVFVFHEGDYYRTRLTHSIEVAQIARTISRALGLNEDLAEALALAHDFGHTAFGHAGEEALAACMADYGGFDHNAQTIRVVTTLEKRYAGFDGLNLTWETLEGLAKHNGPVVPGPIDPLHPPAHLHFGLAEYLKRQDLELHTHAGAEAQVAALADDIAYNNHDIDDGLRAGLFTLECLRGLPAIGERIAEAKTAYPHVEAQRLHYEVVRRMIGLMVQDAITESRRRLEALKPDSPQVIRAASGPVIAFSDGMREAEKALKSFLHVRMYRHYRVNRMSSKAKRVVTDLFTLYIREPDLLPPEWAEAACGPKTWETARVVADYIAGMTDRYALRDHQKLFDLSGLSI